MRKHADHVRKNFFLMLIFPIIQTHGTRVTSPKNGSFVMLCKTKAVSLISNMSVLFFLL